MCAMAVEIDRQVVVPYEVVREDKTGERRELRRSDEGKRQVAESGIQHPGATWRFDVAVRIDTKRTRMKPDRLGRIGNPCIKHGNCDGRSRRGLNVPGTLHVDHR